MRAAFMMEDLLQKLHSAVLRLPSIAYGDEKYNRWGPITATINWCEEDYILTQWCAEVVNSFTNAIFVYLAIRGMRNCIKEGHDTIFFVTFMGYMMVGLGSFMFHSTLWYSMQLVDELSMIYTTCLMVWASFSHGRSLTYSAVLGGFLALLAGSVSVIYHYLQDPKFHQNAYALLTVVVLFRSFFMMERYVRDVDPVSVNRMWRLVVSGITIFLSGFAVWNLDNAFCGDLRGWRRAVGLPWGLLAEGHGWWHLLTGIGAYYELQYGIFLRRCLDGSQDEYMLVWDGVFCLPEVVRRRSPGKKAVNGGGSGGGVVNGGAKVKKVQ